MLLAASHPTSARGFILLAPLDAELERFHGEKTRSTGEYDQFLRKMQQLRGRVYLEDGAIRSADLSPDGLHIAQVDELSWHLLTVDAEQRVLGCARFHLHTNAVPFQHLSVRHASIAHSGAWGLALRESVEAELRLAQQIGFSFVEIGGWALAAELRGTTEALQVALSTFAWCRLIGGALGIGTVTQRHSSASILRRMGGASLLWQGTELPGYYDEQYRCGMEVLKFDSRRPNPKYETAVQRLREQIALLRVFTRTPTRICDSSALTIRRVSSPQSTALQQTSAA